MSGQADPAQDGAVADAVLVSAALGGDITAFEGLISRHERQAAAVAYRLLNHRPDTEDVLQQAYLKAHRALGTLKQPQRFGPWLFRIVSNLSLNYRRQRAGRAHLSLESSGADQAESVGIADRLEDTRAASPDQQLLSAELNGAIKEAIAALPRKQRQALTLFSIQGMAQKEVAEVMVCSVEAVKWHVFTARKTLRKKVKDFF